MPRLPHLYNKRLPMNRVALLPLASVTFLASINHTGNSSMEVGIKVIAEDIRAKVVRHVNSCFFTMIAVDDDGRPTKVPALAPQTPDERRRFAEAEVRRAMRREMERKFAEVHGAE